MEVILGIILVVIVIAVAYVLIAWLFVNVGPMLLKIIGGLIALMFIIGCSIGLWTSISAYYKILIDVYGQRLGILIGAVMSLVLLATVSLIVWKIVSGAS